jgi:hypothetical protein
LILYSVKAFQDNKLLFIVKQWQYPSVRGFQVIDELAHAGYFLGG